MLAQKQLNDLAERRRLLMVEADLHRGIIAMETENLRARIEWLGHVRDRVSLGKPWMAAGGVAAGLYVLRHWRKVIRCIPATFSAIRWVSKLRGQRQSQ